MRSNRLKLSIHGNDKDGKNLGFVYNAAPMENKEPSTPRGKRRAEKRKGNKQGKE
jgi:hypothetical protein